MAIGADREQVATIAGERRVDIPAEAAQHRLIRGALRRGELLHRERAEQARAVKLALVQHHFAEARQIVRRGKQSRVPRHAAHIARRFVVHHPSQRPAVRAIAFGRRDARDQRRRRLKHGLPHAQRQEDMFARIVGERLPAEPLDQLAQQDEIYVAVDKVHAGRRLGGLDQGFVDAGLMAAPRWVQHQVLGHARKVCEQVADGDGAFAFLEFRQILRDAIVQTELALLEQFHQGRSGRHHFGQRGQVEDGVHGHRLGGRNQRALAIGLAMDDLALVPDQQDSAWNAILADGLLHGLVQQR